ncbi:Dynamitin-domain-containing protein [Dipodascopsis uninucleata]
MPTDHKCFTLPDVDPSSQDVFETPDLPENDGSLEFMAEEEPNEDIDYSHISTDAARERFLNKTLKASVRSDPINEISISESIDMRIARLQKEVKELTTEVEEMQQSNANEQHQDVQQDLITKLASSLELLTQSRRSEDIISKTIALLGFKPESGLGNSHHGDNFSPATNEDKSFYIDIKKYNDMTITLDERLSKLEKLLGNPSTLKYQRSIHKSIYEQPVIPTLLSMSQKLSVITQSPEKLDPMLQKIKEHLNSVDSLRSASELDGQGEVIEKIRALYNSLSSVERLSDIVPPLIDRLQSLQYVHIEAEQTVTNTKDLYQRVASLNSSITKWQDNLESAEKKVLALEKREKENLQSIRDWIEKLEDQINQL